MRALPTYRIYHVAADGRLAAGEAFSAVNDVEAVVRARLQLIGDRSAELWAGGRLVGRFSRTHAFTPGG